MKKIVIVTIIFILNGVATLASEQAGSQPAPVPPQVVNREKTTQLQLVKELDEEWYDVKVKYREMFKKAMERVDQRIKTLENATDAGSKEKRQLINEELGDLRRARDVMKQELDELKAATAVNILNIKNRVSDFFEDMAD